VDLLHIILTKQDQKINLKNAKKFQKQKFKFLHISPVIWEAEIWRIAAKS
jgi:hypothetical protein